LPQIPQEAFRRSDETPDEEFYQTPRLVTHIDDRAIAAVTQLYRELFPPGGEILDLMSSWISHLPPEIEYRRVIGLGMNEVELRRNERLDSYLVQNLNTNPELPFGEAEFDGAGICVSIDYLIRPAEVLGEVGRVLKPGAPLVVSFSNRCFPSKAIAIWHQLDDHGHMRLVEDYFQGAGNSAMSVASTEVPAACSPTRSTPSLRRARGPTLVYRRVRLGGQAAKRREMNIRQANGIGRVHVAKPQLRETYCGRPINDEDWVTTTREANCTGCARAGAPGLGRTAGASR